MKLGTMAGWSGFSGTPSNFKTLGEWGIDSCRVVRSSSGDDELVFDIAPDRASDVFPVGHYATVVLQTDAGVTVFRGLVLRPGRMLEGRQRMQFAAEGPMCFLNRLPFVQEWKLIGTGVSEGTTFDSSVVVMNQTLDEGDLVKTDTKNQIAEVLAAAVAKSAPISYSVAGLPAELFPPEDEMTDAWCADILRAQLRWSPSVVPWWRYASAAPQLKFVDTASESYGDPGFDLDGDDDVVEFSINEIEGLRHAARADVLVRQVTIRWIKEAEDTVGGDTLQVNTSVDDVSTVANGAFGEVLITVRMRGPLTTMSGAIVPPEEGPFMGLAAALHAPFKTLRHGASFRVMGQECLWAYHPGQLVNITGGPAELEDARMPIQTVEHDVVHGVTTFSCGPTGQRSFDDLYTLVRANRRRTAVKSSTDRVTGEPSGVTGGGSSGGSGGIGGPAPDVYSMYVCEGGVPVLKDFLVQAAE